MFPESSLTGPAPRGMIEAAMGALRNVELKLTDGEVYLVLRDQGTPISERHRSYRGIRQGQRLALSREIPPEGARADLAHHYRASGREVASLSARSFRW